MMYSYRIQKTIGDLEKRGIRYCHFKSNNNLATSLLGEGDLDLLVDMDLQSQFEDILYSNGFVPAEDTSCFKKPSVFHYYGLDEQSGKILHFHVYYKLISGGSLVKNFRIPIEEYMLNNLDTKHGIKIPRKEVDLAFFIVRKFLEQTIFLEHYLFLKDRSNILREIEYLTNNLDWSTLERVQRESFPFFRPKFITDCVHALQMQAGPWQRIKLGLIVRRHFSNLVYPSLRASIERARIFILAYVRARIGSKLKGRHLRTGGRIIAFVGSEASGKSTLSLSVADWLCENFDVTHIHLGKPPKSLLTLPAWGAIKLAVVVKNAVKSQVVHNREGALGRNDKKTSDNIVHPLVSLLDAVDRYRAVKRITRLSNRGQFVITDRYPNSSIGAIDGPNIMSTAGIWKWAAILERHLYTRISRPDLVIRAMAPLELTLQRNRLRTKTENEEFVIKRYQQAANISFPLTKVVVIDTSETFEKSLLEVKKIIWPGSSCASMEN